MSDNVDWKARHQEMVTQRDEHKQCADELDVMVRRLETQLAEIEKVNIHKIRYWSNTLDNELSNDNIEELCDLLRELPEKI